MRGHPLEREGRDVFRVVFSRDPPAAHVTPDPWLLAPRSFSHLPPETPWLLLPTDNSAALREMRRGNSEARVWMEKDSPLTFCSSSQNKSSLFPWLSHRGPIYNRGVGMEPFPDHSVPKLGRREVTSLGLIMGVGASGSQA